MMERSKGTEIQSAILHAPSSGLWRRILIALAVILPLLGILAYGFKRDPRFIPSPLVGRIAPAFALTLFDGRTIRSEELRGKVVFLNFWSSWCVPCRNEAKELEAAWQGRKAQDAVFVGIAIQDTEDAARAFIREFNVTYLNGLDASGKIAIDFGVWGIPETFFIDREGRITYKHVGSLGPAVIHAKLEDAARGIVTVEEGKGSHLSIK